MEIKNSQKIILSRFSGPDKCFWSVSHYKTVSKDELQQVHNIECEAELDTERTEYNSTKSTVTQRE